MARGTRLATIPGRVPQLVDLPAGCPFAERCSFVIDDCRRALPPALPVAPGHDARCIRLDAVLYLAEEDAYYIYYSGTTGSIQDRIGLAICPAGADDLSSWARRIDDAARTLGGSRWYVFRRVTLPMVAPSLVAGAVLCWARALGEFGATITFAGNLPGRTQTMPLAVYVGFENGLDRALVLPELAAWEGVAPTHTTGDS